MLVNYKNKKQEMNQNPKIFTIWPFTAVCHPFPLVEGVVCGWLAPTGKMNS